MSEAMIVQEGIDDLLPMAGRSRGLHVSAIISELCMQLGHYRKGGEFGDRQSLFELGNCFEEALITAMKRRYAESEGRFVDIGELEMDGIFGTPDLLDTESMAVIEIKLTWMSAKHAVDSEKYWRYWVQLMAYCRMMEVQTGQLHVCFINGDYGKTTRGPIYRVWEREFEEQELWENWRMLETHGEAMEKTWEKEG